MEVKLDDLIEKIKQEGIADGKAAGDEIEKTAQHRATALVEAAKAEAAEIVARGKKEAAQFQLNAERALKQAARDSELAMRERISELFDRVFKAKVAAALTPELIAELVRKLAAGWQDGAGIELVIAPADEQKLRDLLLAGVRDELAKTITLRPSPAITAGFRISRKGEDVAYDFSDASFAELLRSFVNPAIRKLLAG